MKLEEFLIKAEGDDSRHLPDGRLASTWDALGRVFNIGPGLTKGVTKTTVWTPEQLKAAEEAEFAATRAAVTNLVKVPLGENQRTAVESLVYNIGVSGFAHSTVLRMINAHNFAAVPAAFRMWNKAGGKVVKGLINRREAEIRLWLHPDDVPPPADLKASKNVPQAVLSTEEVSPAMNPALTQLISILEAIAPSIATALGGPLAGAAVTAVAGALGVPAQAETVAAAAASKPASELQAVLASVEASFAAALNVPANSAQTPQGPIIDSLTNDVKLVLVALGVWLSTWLSHYVDVNALQTLAAPVLAAGVAGLGAFLQRRTVAQSNVATKAVIAKAA